MITLEVSYVGNWKEEYEGYICAISKFTPVEVCVLPLLGIPEQMNELMMNTYDII